MTFRLGIDLGGSKTEVVVLDAGNQPLYRRRVVTPAHSYTAILAMIEQLVKVAEEELAVSASIGIGTPGAISARSGLMRNSNTQCINAQPLLQDIEARLGRPVRIQNDANCFALSEAHSGAGVGHALVFGVIIGTGTGAGLVVDGHLLQGRHAIAGEWGHNPLPWLRAEDGGQPCYCGKNACIETFLCGPGLARNYLATYASSLDSADIVAAAATGEASCVEMMALYFDQMARALAHVINIVDPDAIVLGGGMSNIDAIYQQIPLRLPAYVFSDYVETPILPALHGDASGVFGAAMLW